MLLISCFTNLFFNLRILPTIYRLLKYSTMTRSEELFNWVVGEVKGISPFFVHRKIAYFLSNNLMNMREEETTASSIARLGNN